MRRPCHFEFREAKSARDFSGWEWSAIQNRRAQTLKRLFVCCTWRIYSPAVAVVQGFAVDSTWAQPHLFLGCRPWHEMEELWFWCALTKSIIVDMQFSNNYLSRKERTTPHWCQINLVRMRRICKAFLGFLSILIMETTTIKGSCSVMESWRNLESYSGTKENRQNMYNW